MIRFTLACDKGHDFESWFRDNASYEDQAARGLLSCPVCQSANIGKAVMAPQVARKDRGAGAPAPEASHALVSPEAAELRQRIRELRAALTRDSDYVGEKFADEARKMHFGEIDRRTIHGEADGEAVRGLLEDGVEILPIPGLPEDRN